MRHRKRKIGLETRRLPVGMLFDKCGCCGQRFGGSTPDPLAVCSSCKSAGCNLRRPNKEDAVRCS